MHKPIHVSWVVLATLGIEVEFDQTHWRASEVSNAVIGGDMLLHRGAEIRERTIDTGTRGSGYQWIKDSRGADYGVQRGPG